MAAIFSLSFSARFSALAFSLSAFFIGWNR
jgi:hypothetical protein